MKKITKHRFAFLVLFYFTCVVTFAQDTLDFDKNKVLDEISNNVSEHFYKTTFDTLEWQQHVEATRQHMTKVKTLDHFDIEINQLLATLNASHTYFFSRNNPKRYQLLSIFDFLFDKKDTSLFCYEGIGMDIKRVGGKDFVRAVYDGLPAAKAGLKFGDQIISIDNNKFHPIQSFLGKANSNVKVQIIRDDRQQTLHVPVAILDGRSMFETSLQSSIQTIERNQKKIGYVHVWSYAGAKYQDQLRDAILWGELSESDALILDLRDGWGGADINYLNLFRQSIATIKSTSRNNKIGSYSGVWEKPVVLLTNDQSTSGKELFTYGFKKLKIGKVIGETTAGAVVAGRIFKLSSGDVLYLAVKDVHVDGTRLEGIGVEPDIIIRRSIELGADDPQMEKALEELSQ